jgi:hypothetical protein
MAAGMNPNQVLEAEEEAPALLPVLSEADKEAKRKKTRAARRARKAQRR